MISGLSAAFHCFVTQSQHSCDNLDEGPPLRRSFGPWHRRWSNKIGKNSTVVSEVRGWPEHVWLGRAHRDKPGGAYPQYIWSRVTRLWSDLILIILRRNAQLKKHLSCWEQLEDLKTILELTYRCLTAKMTPLQVTSHQFNTAWVKVLVYMILTVFKYSYWI